jgi:3'-phosphoadenosine 5'-phosphosulfate sulfotransferase
MGNSGIYKITSPTGKIYVGGNFITYNGSTSNRIIRLNTDGTVDTSFNVGTGFNNTVRSIIEDSNGALYVGGDFTSYKGTSNNNRVIKLDSSGNKITSFDNSTGFNTGVVWNLSLNSDETILYCAGAFTAYKGTTRNRLAAINTSNGSLNTTFNTSVGANSTVIDILPTSSGIYVTGSFTSVNGTSINRIARLQTNGNVDTGFNVGAGANNTGYSLIEDSSGNIYFGGVFTSYKGTTRNRIVKIDSSGDIDTSFNVGNGTNSSVYKLKQDSDGKILLGGAFSSYNSTGRLRLARANTNGSSDTTLSIGSGFDRGYHRFRFIYYYRNASNTLASLSVFPGSFTNGYRAIEEINDDITEKWIQSTVTVGPDENFKVYFNGELKSTNPLPAGSQDIGFSITKLGTYASTSGPLKGNLSLVKVYDRRLSDDEILQNYNATKSRFGL